VDSLAEKIIKLGRTAPLSPEIHKIALVEGERRIVTTLFVDLEGFVAISDQLDHEVVKQLVDGCFQQFLQVVHKYNGFLDKIVGDSMMVVFGLETSEIDDPERACYCAMDIFLEMDKINRIFETGEPLNIHIGINTGEVTVGRVATKRDRDFSVIGDSVNMASRLVNMAKAGEILVGEETYSLVKKKFQFESLGSVKIRGKQFSQNIFRLMSSRLEEEQTGENVIIGQEKVFHEMEDYISGYSKHETGQAIWISGSSGAGKSTVVSEAIFRHLRNWTLIKVEGYSLPNDQSIIFRNIILEIARNNPAEFLMSWKNKIGEDSPVYRWLNAFLMHGQTEFPIQTKEILGVVRLSIQSALPVCIWVDQFHQLEPSIHKSFVNLSETIPGTLWMFSGDMDIKERQNSKNLWLEIPRLDLNETEELLQMKLGKSVDENLVRKIFERTDGNPQLILNYVELFAEKSALYTADGKIFLKNQEILKVLPSSVRGIFQNRIDMLDYDSKKMVQFASILGIQFSMAILQKMSEDFGESKDFNAAMTHLHQSGILIKDQQNLRFAKPIFREVVYSNLLNQNKKIIHNWAGQVYQKLSQNTSTEFYLAYHFAHAENEKAVGYSLEAIRWTFKNYKWREGVALGHLIHNRLLSKRQDFSEHEVDFYLEWIRLLQRISDWKQIEKLLVFIRPFCKSGVLLKKWRASKQLLLLMTGRYENSIEEGLTALKISDGKEQLIGKIFQNLGLAYIKANQRKCGIEYYQKAKQIWEKTDDVQSLISVSINIAGQLRIDEDFKKSLNLLNTAMTLLGKYPDFWKEAVLQSQMGKIYEKQKDFKYGLFCHKKSLDLAERSLDSRLIGDCLSNLAECYFEIGKLEDAEECIRKFEMVPSKSREAKVEMALLEFDIAKSNQNITKVEQKLKDLLEIGINEKEKMEIQNCLGLIKKGGIE